MVIGIAAYKGKHFAGEHASLAHAWIQGAVESGLRAAREKRPDAIVLDIIMPGVDGWAFFEEVRRYLEKNYGRDGAMRFDSNGGGDPGYEPNSYGEWQQQPETAEPPLSLEGAADVVRIDHPPGNAHHTAAVDGRNVRAGQADQGRVDFQP